MDDGGVGRIKTEKTDGPGEERGEERREGETAFLQNDFPELIVFGA